MDLCEGGQLWERIRECQVYPEAEAAIVMRTMVQLLRDCHAMGIMHRDIKPENILLLSTEDNCAVKVVDFGVAMFFRPGEME